MAEIKPAEISAILKKQVEGFETGADAYVEKPFNVSILLATIKNLLHSRQNITPLLKGENVTRQMTPDESFLSDIVEIIKSNLTNSMMPTIYSPR